MEKTVMEFESSRYVIKVLNDFINSYMEKGYELEEKLENKIKTYRLTKENNSINITIQLVVVGEKVYSEIQKGYTAEGKMKLDINLEAHDVFTYNEFANDVKEAFGDVNINKVNKGIH